jgi:predicted kinase
MTAAADPFVVVISGSPGSGKTTLGWELSRALHVAFLSRDDFKTGLHVTYRSGDPVETQRFSALAFSTFYEAAQLLIKAGVSVVIEAAFHSGVSEPSIEHLGVTAKIIHVALNTDRATALRRYRARAEAGLRHPAHDDFRFAEEMESGRKDTRVYRLGLPCPTITVDGDDGWKPNLAEIARFVHNSR